MDLDSFLEKDIVTYLENAVKFGVKDREEGIDDADALLATKEDSKKSRKKGKKATEDGDVSVDGGVSVDGDLDVDEGITVKGGLSVDGDIKTTGGVENSAVENSTVEIKSAQIVIDKPVAQEGSDSTQTPADDSEKTYSKEEFKQGFKEGYKEGLAEELAKTPDSPAPVEGALNDAESAVALASQPAPEWFDELEDKATQARAELDKIVDMEDSLNDLLAALDNHDVDKAKALYDHLVQETNDIAFHPQEKVFLLGELKQFAGRLEQEKQRPPEEVASVDAPVVSPGIVPAVAPEVAPDPSTEHLVGQHQEDSPSAANNSAQEPLVHPGLVEEGVSDLLQEPTDSKNVASDVALDELTGEFVKIPPKLSPEPSSEDEVVSGPSLPLPGVIPADLPPSFVEEETLVVYSYVEGVSALRNKDKSKALEIFLHLAKERPANLAIKIRLQEAIELP